MYKNFITHRCPTLPHRHLTPCPWESWFNQTWIYIQDDASHKLKLFWPNEFWDFFLKSKQNVQKNNNSGSEKEDENVRRTRKLAAMWYMYWMMGPPPPHTHTYTQTKQKQNKIKIKQKGQKQNSRTAIKTTAHVCTIQFSKIPTCPYSRKYKLLLPYYKTYNVPKYTRILYSIDSKKYNINSKLAGQIVAAFSGLLWKTLSRCCLCFT